MLGSLITTALITLATALGGIYTNNHDNLSDSRSSSSSADSSIHRPGIIQQALTPPTEYDYSIQQGNYSYGFRYFATGSDADPFFGADEFKMGKLSAEVYSRSWDFPGSDGLLEYTLTLESPSTSFIYNSGDNSYTPTSALGAGTTATSIQKWSFAISNYSIHDFNFIFDISTSAADKLFYYSLHRDNTLISRCNLSLRSNSLTWNNALLPALTTIKIEAYGSLTAYFLDAIYVKDLGVNDAYTYAGVTYDIGYADGIDDANQPWTLLDGVQTILGAGLNSIFIFLSLDFFGIELSSILGILLGGVMLIWILKLLRG